MIKYINGTLTFIYSYDTPRYILYSIELLNSNLTLISFKKFLKKHGRIASVYLVLSFGILVIPGQKPLVTWNTLGIIYTSTYVV